jgi:hypothetical protein
VAWAELEHAYDNAADIPDLLRALGDGDLEVLQDIFGALCHQGTRYSASAPAVPFLAGILAAGEVDPVPLLMTLGALAIGDMDVYAFPRPPEADGAMDVDAVAAYRAVEREVPVVVVGFLSHEDGQAVAAATWLVSWFPGQKATLPLVLATPPTTTRTLAAGLLGHVPERGGWAEAVAALCAGDVTAFDDVLAAARTMKDLVDETLPYLFGDIAGILAAALMAGPVKRRAEAVAAMRVLADRVGRDRRHAVRYFLERAAVAT